MRTSSTNRSGNKRKTDSEKNKTERRDSGHSRGRISVVGIGPGALEHLTPKARQAIETADVIIGYNTYIKLIQPVIAKTAEVISGGMGQEVERARTAVAKAKENKRVAVVSSGDPGVYGMAGVVLEVAAHEKATVSVDIIPGVTAATAAAAVLGAPLVGDFAVVSLSDLLTPWKLIEERLNAAAKADFVIVLYNPQSQGRKEPLASAHQILLKYRSPDTPVGIVRAVGRDDEKVVITTLGNLLDHEIDMATTIVVGNSATRVINEKMVTPRGYDLLKN
ncbi:MAG: precorrin-3B C(17)-methyltransferase [Candidatus Bathyarchaeota archaeon]|nr:precorrin-3B C(17)-methyltransferase [Candidatus Bathyarchaeota archaeon]